MSCKNNQTHLSTETPYVEYPPHHLRPARDDDFLMAKNRIQNNDIALSAFLKAREKTELSQEEKRALLLYSGWDRGLLNVKNLHPGLPPGMRDAILTVPGSSDLPDSLINAMLSVAIKQANFDVVLDTSIGTGEMPMALLRMGIPLNDVTALEQNPVTAEIAGRLFPRYRIYNGSISRNPLLVKNRYTCILGNSGIGNSLDSEEDPSEQIFSEISQALEHLRGGGHLCYLIPQNLSTNTRSTNALFRDIARKAHWLLTASFPACGETPPSYLVVFEKKDPYLTGSGESEAGFRPPDMQIQDLDDFRPKATRTITVAPKSLPQRCPRCGAFMNGICRNPYCKLAPTRSSDQNVLDEGTTDPSSQTSPSGPNLLRARSALHQCLYELGQVDFGRIAFILGWDIKQTEEFLLARNLVVRDPELGIVDIYSYLSGNIRKKMEAAYRAAKEDPSFEKNILLLSSVVPEWLSIEEMDIEFGDRWIPEEVYRRVSQSYYNVLSYGGRYDFQKDEWVIEQPSHHIEDYARRFLNHINKTPPVEYMHVFADEKQNIRVIDWRKTQEVFHSDIEHLEQSFERQLSAESFRTQIEEYFNNRINTYAPYLPETDGITLMGVNPAVTLKEHQKRAVLRMLRGGNFLLAHGVGSGKAQPHSCRVLTPLGWKPLGQLRIGDRIYAGDASVCTVINLYPQGIQRVWRICLSDGSSTRATGDHLWETLVLSVQGRGMSLRLQTTAQMVQALQEYGEKMPLFVPAVKPLHLYSEPLSTGEKVTTIQQRLDWLARQLDLAGHDVALNTNDLNDADFRSVVFSLGGGFYRTASKTLSFHLPPGLSQQAHIPHPLRPFFDLPNNEDLLYYANRLWRRIRQISECEKEEASCILIDHPDHLYVTDDFIVTHNTYSLIIASMEMKKRGHKKRPVHVVPFSTFKQYREAFTYLYPDAKILEITSQDLHNSQNLREKLNEDWDAILITQPAFDNLTLSPSAYQEIFSEEIAFWTQQYLDAETEEKRQFFQKKVTEITCQKDLLSSNATSTQILYWDDLKADQVFIDEADRYKGLPISSHRYDLDDLSGIASSESQRAVNALHKIRLVQARDPHFGGVVFATGTPISNSMVEIYNWQTFLDPQFLRENFHDRFDFWADMFVEAGQSLEMDVDGRNYRAVRRANRFRHVRQLRQIIGRFADFYFPSTMATPQKLLGGKRQAIICETNPETQDILRTITQRISIAGFSPPQEKTHIFSLINKAKLASLDARLVNPRAKDNPANKINTAAKKIVEIYKTKKDVTQVVFCDIGIYSNESQFSVYRELVRKLVQSGIPETEIAVAQEYSNDAERQRLFEKVDNGEIKVLIGSTATAGIGANYQSKLYALHHLDIPWRPRDIIQREGRLLRPDNQNSEVAIYNYIAPETFDSYLWQVVDQKYKAFSQFISSDTPDELPDRVDGIAQAVDYSELRAMSVKDTRYQRLLQVQKEISEIEPMVRKQKALRKRAIRIRSLAESRRAMLEKAVQRSYQQYQILQSAGLLDKHSEIRFKYENGLVSRDEASIFGGLSEVERKMRYGEILSNRIKCGELNGLPLYLCRNDSDIVAELDLGEALPPLVIPPKSNGRIFEENDPHLNRDHLLRRLQSTEKSCEDIRNQIAWLDKQIEQLPNPTAENEQMENLYEKLSHEMNELSRQIQDNSKIGNIRLVMPS